MWVAFLKSSMSMPASMARLGEMPRASAGRLSNPNLIGTTLRDNKTKEIARLNAIYERLLTSPGVDIIEGHGTLAGAPNGGCR